jgi:hypothetical protein
MQRSRYRQWGTISVGLIHNVRAPGLVHTTPANNGYQSINPRSQATGKGTTGLQLDFPIPILVVTRNTRDQVACHLVELIQELQVRLVDFPRSGR